MKRLLLCLSLVGCASPAPPEPIIREVEIKVPVRVPCEVPEIAAPTYPFEGATQAMELDNKVKLLLADRLVREAEARELRAALNGCRK